MVSSGLSCSIAQSVPHPWQISTRSYYSPDVAVEICRRSGQSLSLPLPQSQSTLSDHQSDTSDGLHCRLSPSSEIDGKSSSGQARRRIAVAVSCDPVNTCAGLHNH